MLPQDIVISEHYPADVLSDFPGYYLNHILCLEGHVTFQMAGQNFELQPGDMAIFLPQTSYSNMMFSADYHGQHLLLASRITSANNPSRQWGNKGFVFSFSNPVFRFTEAQIGVFMHDLQMFRERMADTNHIFYAEALGTAVRLFLYDMWNIYSAELEQRITGPDGGPLFERFIALLQMHCRKEREVKFYADKLFITPKYLSEVCRRKSGRSAMEWITDHARQELTDLLKDPQLTLNDIADRMAFQNTSFFCRYVKRVLGKTPTEYRNSL